MINKKNKKQTASLELIAQDYIRSVPISVTKMSDSEYKCANSEFIAYFKIRKNTILSEQCGCMVFQERGICKHIYACRLLLESENTRNSGGKTAFYQASNEMSHWMLKEMTKLFPDMGTILIFFNELEKVDANDDRCSSLFSNMFFRNGKAKRTPRENVKWIRLIIKYMIRNENLLSVHHRWMVFYLLLKFTNDRFYLKSESGLRLVTAIHREIYKINQQDLAPVIKYRIIDELVEFLKHHEYVYLKEYSLFELFEYLNVSVPIESIEFLESNILESKDLDIPLIRMYFQLLAEQNGCSRLVFEKLYRLDENAYYKVVHPGSIQLFREFIGSSDDFLVHKVKMALAEYCSINKCSALLSDPWYVKLMDHLNSQEFSALTNDELCQLGVIAICRENKHALKLIIDNYTGLEILHGLTNSKERITIFQAEINQGLKVYLENHAGIVPIKEVYKIADQIGQHHSQAERKKFLQHAQSSFPLRSILRSYS